MITSSVTPLLIKKIWLVFSKQSFLTTFNFLLFLWYTNLILTKKVKIRKRVINVDSIQNFRDVLCETNWGNLYLISNPNDVYEYFLKIFSGTYDLAFPLKTNLVKRKTLQNPWVTKGFLKPSKWKQKLFWRCLKKVNEIRTFIKHMNLPLKV